MKEIIYGTTNPAKVSQIKSVLEPLGFEVKSLADFDITISVEEDGKTAEENARKKSIEYAKALNAKVLSMDAALYFNDLSEEQQPGLHVRRINKVERASDDELLSHYTSLAKKMGEKIDAYWRYAFALSQPDGECVSTHFDTPRTFVSVPSSTVIEGYPLESIQIDPATGKYISEMSKDETAAFWKESIGRQLEEFVSKNY
ncbi:MAG: non-canonical purine NTP pyrophosphatase [Candidatus Microsaccharimonas sp.]